MPDSLLCETVTADSMAELIRARDSVTADMVELRLDGVADLDVFGAIRHHHSRKGGFFGPVIATCRASWEGGRFDGSEEARRRILEQALDAGASFVDVEWKAGFTDLLVRDPKRIVLSSHDFAGVPRDLDDRVRAMRATGAGTIKIAVSPKRLSESLPLRAIGAEGNAVVIGMGETGVPTRILAAHFGSRWTYAGNAAPGQLSALRMVDEFRFPVIGRSTRVFGVVSTNATHSLSPVMHNAAFGAAEVDAVYVPLRTEDFEDFLEFAAALGIEGASITIPFKGDALLAATYPDETARRVGAVNTLRRRGHDWDATNTDVAGFLEPLEALFPGSLDGVRASVLGAGGSARAVVVALRSRGAEVTVHARRAEQAYEVTSALGATPGAWPPAPESWDLLVNCTPLGGATLRDESPLPGASFDGRVVYDLTYGPGESRLVREARAAGCATLDGLSMLIAQAERQYEWWMGMRPIAGVMRAAAYRRLGIEGRAEERRAGIYSPSDGEAI